MVEYYTIQYFYVNNNTSISLWGMENHPRTFRFHTVHNPFICKQWKIILQFRQCPTWLCDVRDVHSLLGGHEAQDGEDHEPGEKTGSTVDQSQDESIPGTNAGRCRQCIDESEWDSTSSHVSNDTIERSYL